MNIQGRDCLIMIKTRYCEVGIPYAEETIREAAVLLTEEASLEGDGACRAIRKIGGVTGCVVTPLTMGTAPLLLWLALGGAEEPLYVSETRDLYMRRLRLLPAEDCIRFAVEQDRGGSRKIYGGCVVSSFELRIVREGAVKLKLAMRGEQPAIAWLDKNRAPAEAGERFMGDRVVCRINGVEKRNIYGLTLSVQKEGGTRTELRIKRALEQGGDLPGTIEELIITAQLLRDKYECRHCGIFRITLKGLALMSDETVVDCADAVIGPLRYYVAGRVEAEVFANSGDTLA